MRRSPLHAAPASTTSLATSRQKRGRKKHRKPGWGTNKCNEKRRDLGHNHSRSRNERMRGKYTAAVTQQHVTSTAGSSIHTAQQRRPTPRAQRAQIGAKGIDRLSSMRAPRSHRTAHRQTHCVNLFIIASARRGTRRIPISGAHRPAGSTNHSRRRFDQPPCTHRPPTAPRLSSILVVG
jgi:hypothetical protein